MPYSCRQSHCSFTVRGKHGESHVEEKEEELEIEDLNRTSLSGNAINKLSDLMTL
jgi:hypothetical protein